MVNVLKERFEEMYQLRKYSERKLGLEIEKLKKENKPGAISYRTLQRYLEIGDMKYETLVLCAEKLDCRKAYLCGEFLGSVESFKQQIKILSAGKEKLYSEHCDSRGVSFIDDETFKEILEIERQINVLKANLSRRKYFDSLGRYTGRHADDTMSETAYNAFSLFSDWLTSVSYDPDDNSRNQLSAMRIKENKEAYFNANDLDVKQKIDLHFKTIGFVWSYFEKENLLRYRDENDSESEE